MLSNALKSDEDRFAVFGSLAHISPIREHIGAHWQRQHKLRLRLAMRQTPFAALGSRVRRTSQIVFLDSKKENIAELEERNATGGNGVLNQPASMQRAHRIQISFGAAIVLFLLFFRKFSSHFSPYSRRSRFHPTLNRFKIHYSIFRISSAQSPFRSFPFLVRSRLHMHSIY